MNQSCLCCVFLTHLLVSKLAGVVQRGQTFAVGLPQICRAPGETNQGEVMACQVWMHSCCIRLAQSLDGCLVAVLGGLEQLHAAQHAKERQKTNKQKGKQDEAKQKGHGLRGESNPGPLAPKARIIPLDHKAVLPCRSAHGFMIASARNNPLLRTACRSTIAARPCAHSSR
jgi:hypothetical protein